MRTTSGSLTDLSYRLGAFFTPTLVLLAVALAAVIVLAAMAVAGLLLAAVEPVQVAPVRWTYRS